MTTTPASTRHQKGQTHSLAGQSVVIAGGRFGGSEFAIEDWWDTLTGGSWMFADGNPACLEYAIRSAIEALPVDDEVVYGKVDGLGKLIHASQLPAQ